MFFFKSSRKKALEQARDWVAMAQKIDHFRRDVLPESDLNELRQKRDVLEQSLKSKESTPEEWSQKVEDLEKVVRRTGGSFYPRNFWVENIEMVLVAGILAIGVRTFFLQPFKIPTNSMYPTYNGMTTEVYFGDEAPSVPQRIFQTLRLGAGHRSVEGEAGDELKLIVKRSSDYDRQGREIPLRVPEVEMSQFYIPGREVSGRKWFVFPDTRLQVDVMIGDKIVGIKVPLDFRSELQGILEDVVRRGKYADSFERGPGNTLILGTGVKAADNGVAFSFDILSGDMLFVDRFSYNFVEPSIGDPIVFRTDNIKFMPESERDKYYIKRLVGREGDRLEVVPPGLKRNGEPISGAKAFDLNREQEGEYEGYIFFPSHNPYPGTAPIDVPEDSYFAMGDNSDQSSDSRVWGFVPDTAVIGKAVFIYYPFSHRWGPSH